MTVLQWSPEMDYLYLEEVIQPVMGHKATDATNNVRLGYPFSVIVSDVIEQGLADFGVGHTDDRYGTLSADEKVLLYCFANMRLHFFESLWLFRYHMPTLRKLFDSQYPTLMIDLGCGPATAGLALAEALDRPKLRYVGFDIAKPMLSKALTMLKAAESKQLIAANSHYECRRWIQLPAVADALDERCNMIVNASYLFASDTLKINDLSEAILALKQHKCVQRLLLTYTNSTKTIAGTGFTKFTTNLEGEFTTKGLFRTTIEYRNRRSGQPAKPATFRRQLLNFK